MPFLVPLFRYEPTFRTTSGITSGVISGQSHFQWSYDPWLIFLSFQFSRIFIFLFFSIFVYLRSVTDFNNEIYFYYIRTRKFLNARNQKSSLIIFRLYSEKFLNFHFWGKITKITTRLNFQIFTSSPYINFINFLKMAIPIIIFVKNHIHVESVKIQEFALVIILAIFRQKWQFRLENENFVILIVWFTKFSSKLPFRQWLYFQTEEFCLKFIQNNHTWVNIPFHLKSKPFYFEINVGKRWIRLWRLWMTSYSIDFVSIETYH